MLLSVFLISTLFIVALYGLTLAYYMLLKPVESSKKAERELPFVSVLVMKKLRLLAASSRCSLKIIQILN